MKPSTTAIVIAALLAVAGFFFLGWDCARRRYENPSNRPDTVTITKWIHDSIPYPVDSIVYKTKLVYLPVHDTTEVHDTTTVRDSALVEVPIMERSYASENYRATVRGYNPELVDIWVKQKETTITVPYRKRWGVTVGPQVGYGMTMQGWQPYVGFGATFGYSF